MSPPKQTRHRRWPYIMGVIAAGFALLVAFWNWDWFLPIVDARASAALGRPVHATHLHVSLGRQTTVALDGITIANPAGFADNPPFASIDRLAVTIDVMAFIDHRDIVLPVIDVTRPTIEAVAHDDGQANWQMPSSGGSSSGPAPRIGRLIITDGHAHVLDPRMRADFHIDITTKPDRATSIATSNNATMQGDGTIQTGAASGVQPGNASGLQPGDASGVQPGDASGVQPGDASRDRIVVSARGTYAGQPIEAHGSGGALLTLRDTSTPYPVELHVANGPTKVDLQGSVRDPMNFAGADLTLRLAGPDMSLLLPLTGIAIPKTPSYSIAGKLDYAAGTIKFHDFDGRVGSSDLEGDIDVKTGGARPDATMKLASRQVDLADLGGFLGSEPGRVSTPDQTAAQREAVARAEASPKLLPTKPISVPRLRAADIHLDYRAASIKGRDIPFDSMSVVLDLVDGRIELHPVTFTVGRGDIAGDITLDPKSPSDIAADASIKFQHVDLSRVMRATHLFKGGGTIGGTASIKTEGNSVATFLGRGDGDLKLAMAGGGNLSALLVDLSGLQLGNGILSAIGVPSRAQVECMIVDMALEHGDLKTRTFLIDTTEGRITGAGSINLGRESIDYTITTRSKHFSVGSLPGPVVISGTFKDPTIRPGAETIARTGAAIGLGIIAAPLALLPTIQFGTGEDNACGRLLKEHND